MTIRVRFFAVAREIVGAESLSLDLGEGSTVQSAIDRLFQDHPRLAPHAKKLATAVNLEYVDRGYCLKAGDELALIPPVSGG